MGDESQQYNKALPIHTHRNAHSLLQYLASHCPQAPLSALRLGGMRADFTWRREAIILSFKGNKAPFTQDFPRQSLDCSMVGTKPIVALLCPYSTPMPCPTIHQTPASCTAMNDLVRPLSPAQLQLTLSLNILSAHSSTPCCAQSWTGKDKKF